MKTICAMRNDMDTMLMPFPPPNLVTGGLYIGGVTPPVAAAVGAA